MISLQLIHIMHNNQENMIKNSIFNQKVLQTRFQTHYIMDINRIYVKNKILQKKNPKIKTKLKTEQDSADINSYFLGLKVIQSEPQLSKLRKPPNFHRTFNKSSIDQQHNFIGKRYLNKILQEKEKEMRRKSLSLTSQEFIPNPQDRHHHQMTQKLKKIINSHHQSPISKQAITKDKLHQFKIDQSTFFRKRRIVYESRRISPEDSKMSLKIEISKQCQNMIKCQARKSQEEFKKTNVFSIRKHIGNHKDFIIKQSVNYRKIDSRIQPWNSFQGKTAEIYVDDL